jgi:hypothetical protein
MNGRNEEDVKELFERFVNTGQAEEAEQDIRKGEQILREHPVSEPDSKLIADIKAEVGKAVLRRKTKVFRRMVYKSAVIAASVIFLAAIGIELFEKGGESERVIAASILPAAIWESDDISADDADLATLTAEIEQIESDVLALQLGENGSNGYEAAAELEMELMEINNDFWKG